LNLQLEAQVIPFGQFPMKENSRRASELDDDDGDSGASIKVKD